MLTEERQNIILEEIKRKSVVYVSDLVELLDSSESTIRRDLNTLHKNGKLKKVHGGATSLNRKINTNEDIVSIRQSINVQDKVKIAALAAEQIEVNDFVYIDAGTTTELMIDFIKEKEAIFVTNGIDHAKKLISKGFKTFILAGEIKITTEAIIGVEAVNSLKKYNFTKGFFGANGVCKDRGYTTPDVTEASVKEEALNRTDKAYILVDSSKINEVSSVTFGKIDDATIITTKIEDSTYKELTEIVEV